jgi:hypothetical protein
MLKIKLKAPKRRVEGMDKINRNVILFSGQSGQKMMNCLNKLKGELNNKNVQIFSIEKQMEYITGKNFRDLLTLPLPELERIWINAFDEVYSQIEKSDTLIFLTFHSVYFHQVFRSFVYHIDLERFSRLRDKVKLFITFIDDIYDIYERLVVPGEMFHSILDLARKSRGEGESILETIINLHTLLNWREAEIGHSREIARFLSTSHRSVPFYVIPIKYPAFMVARLIEQEDDQLKIYYLSHPIRLAREGGKISLVGEVNNITRKIIQKSHVFLFYPTGIDERRFEHENGLYKPLLLWRWDSPVPDNKMIMPPLKHPYLKNPLNPLNEEVSKSLELPLSFQLKLLIDKIDKQITSRDYIFIECSKDGVIGFKPDFNSDDIQREFEYNIQLWKTGVKERNKSQRKNIVLTSRDDIAGWRREKLHGSLADKYERIDTWTLEKITLDLLPKLGNINIINQSGFPIINLDNIIPSDFIRALKDLKEGGELISFLTTQKIKEPPSREGVLGPEIMTLEKERHKALLDEAIEEIKIPPLLKILSEVKEISICVTIEDLDLDAFLEQTL